jgi:glutathione S-transferase
MTERSARQSSVISGSAPAEGLRLYQGDGPNSYRVRIFMAEKGIELPMVRVNLAAMEHRAPEFLKLNSLGQIPVLVLDDGTAIAESVAICRYLEEIHPNPPLFGVGAAERAKVDMWNRRIEIEVFGTIGDVTVHNNEFFKERHVQCPAFSELQREAVPKKWAWLDAELADGRPFLAGERFSIADISGAVAGWLGDVFGMHIPPELSNVLRWIERVKARPSWNA